MKTTTKNIRKNAHKKIKALLESATTIIYTPFDSDMHTGCWTYGDDREITAEQAMKYAKEYYNYEPRFTLTCDEDGNPVQLEYNVRAVFGYFIATFEKKSADEPQEFSRDSFEVNSFDHTKTKLPLFSASLNHSVSKKAFIKIKDICLMHHGWYSSYSADGAIKGFLFHTEKQRDAFLSKIDFLFPVKAEETPAKLCLPETLNLEKAHKPEQLSTGSVSVNDDLDAIHAHDENDPEKRIVKIKVLWSETGYYEEKTEYTLSDYTHIENMVFKHGLCDEHAGYYKTKVEVTLASGEVCNYRHDICHSERDIVVQWGLWVDYCRNDSQPEPTEPTAQPAPEVMLMVDSSEITEPATLTEINPDVIEDTNHQDLEILTKEIEDQKNLPALLPIIQPEESDKNNHHQEKQEKRQEGETSGSDIVTYKEVIGAIRQDYRVLIGCNNSSNEEDEQLKQVRSQVESYQHDLRVLDEACSMVEERHDLIDALSRLDSSSGSYSPCVKNKEEAKLRYKKFHWNSIVNTMGGFMEIMGHKQKADLRDQLEKPDELPEFNEDNIINILSMNNSKASDYFVNNVDNLFQSLSPEHVTNTPEGFYKRMIYKGYPSGDSSILTYDSMKKICDILTDFRKILFLLFNKPIEQVTTSGTEEIIRMCFLETGEWHSVDGNAFDVKTYKNGNMWIRVHPELAIKLNAILAEKYPKAIPNKFRSKREAEKKIKTDFDILYKNESFMPVSISKASKMQTNVDLITSLTDKLAESSPTKKEVLEKYKSYYKVTCDVGHSETLKQVMKYLGGKMFNVTTSRKRMSYPFTTIEIDSTIYAFNHWECSVKKAISSVFLNGYIPEYKSHQYYPTPDSVSSKCMEHINIEDGETWGEYSAGTGNLIKAMTKKAKIKIKAVEHNHMNANIIKSFFNSQDVIVGDFLKTSLSKIGEVDGFFINPPYTKKQWLSHVLYALKTLKQGKKGYAILPESCESTLIKEGVDFSLKETFVNEFENTQVKTVLIEFAA